MPQPNILISLYRFVADPPYPTFQNPRHQPEADTTIIIHALTQYLIDLRPHLREHPYSRTLNNELAALVHAAYAAIDTYAHMKGAP